MEAEERAKRAMEHIRAAKRAMESQAVLWSEPDWSGYLDKYNEVSSAWERRFCVVRGTYLYYFINELAIYPIGLIPLEGCEVSEGTGQSSRRYNFVIKMGLLYAGHATQDDFVLAATTAELLKDVIEVLEDASSPPDDLCDYLFKTWARESELRSMLAKSSNDKKVLASIEGANALALKAELVNTYVEMEELMRKVEAKSAEGLTKEQDSLRASVQWDIASSKGNEKHLQASHSRKSPLDRLNHEAQLTKQLCQILQKKANLMQGKGLEDLTEAARKLLRCMVRLATEVTHERHAKVHAEAPRYSFPVDPSVYNRGSDISENKVATVILPPPGVSPLRRALNAPSPTQPTSSLRQPPSRMAGMAVPMPHTQPPMPPEPPVSAAISQQPSPSEEQKTSDRLQSRFLRFFSLSKSAAAKEASPSRHQLSSPPIRHKAPKQVPEPLPAAPSLPTRAAVARGKRPPQTVQSVQQDANVSAAPTVTESAELTVVSSSKHSKPPRAPLAKATPSSTTSKPAEDSEIGPPASKPDESQVGSSEVSEAASLPEDSHTASLKVLSQLFNKPHVPPASTTPDAEAGSVKALSELFTKPSPSETGTPAAQASVRRPCAPFIPALQGRAPQPGGTRPVMPPIQPAQTPSAQRPLSSIASTSTVQVRTTGQTAPTQVRSAAQTAPTTSRQPTRHNPLERPKQAVVPKPQQLAPSLLVQGAAQPAQFRPPALLPRPVTPASPQVQPPITAPRPLTPVVSWQVRPPVQPARPVSQPASYTPSSLALQLGPSPFQERSISAPVSAYTVRTHTTTPGAATAGPLSRPGAVSATGLGTTQPAAVARGPYVHAAPNVHHKAAQALAHPAADSLVRPIAPATIAENAARRAGKAVAFHTPAQPYATSPLLKSVPAVTGSVPDSGTKVLASAHVLSEVHKHVQEPVHTTAHYHHPVTAHAVPSASAALHGSPGPAVHALDAGDEGDQVALRFAPMAHRVTVHLAPKEFPAASGHLPTTDQFSHPAHFATPRAAAARVPTETHSSPTHGRAGPGIHLLDTGLSDSLSDKVALRFASTPHRVTVHLAPKDLPATTETSEEMVPYPVYDSSTHFQSPKRARPAHAESPKVLHASDYATSDDEVAVRFAPTPHRVTVHLAPKDFGATETTKEISSSDYSTHQHRPAQGHADPHYPHRPVHGHTDPHYPHKPAHDHTDPGPHRPGHTGDKEAHTAAAHPHIHRPGHADSPDSLENVAVRFAQTPHRVTVHLAPKDFGATETTKEISSSDYSTHQHRPAQGHADPHYPHRPVHGHTDPHYPHKPAHDHTDPGPHRPGHTGDKEARTAAAHPHIHRPGHADSPDSLENVAVRFAQTPHRVTVHLAPKDFGATETTKEISSSDYSTHQHRPAQGHADPHYPHRPVHGHTDPHYPHRPAHEHTDPNPHRPGHTESHPRPAHGDKEAHIHTAAHPHIHRPGHADSPQAPPDSSENVAVRFAQTPHRVTVHLAPKDFGATDYHHTAAHGHPENHLRTADGHTDSHHGATQGHADFHPHTLAGGHREAAGHTAAARSHSPVHHRPGHADSPDSFDDKVAVRFAQTQHRVTVHLAPQDFTSSEASSAHGPAALEGHHKPAHDHSAHTAAPETHHRTDTGHTDIHPHKPADGHRAARSHSPADGHGEAGGHTAAARPHSPAHHRLGHTDSSEDSFDDKVALRFAQTPHRVTVHLAPKDLTAAEKSSARGPAAVQGHRDRHCETRHGGFHGHTDSQPHRPAHSRKKDSHAAPARSRSPAHRPGSPHAALISEESAEKVAVHFAQTQHRVTVHLAPEDFKAETSSTHRSAALEGRTDYHLTAHDHSKSPHGATQGHTDFHRHRPGDDHKGAGGHTAAARSHSPAHHRPEHTDSPDDSFDDKVALRFAETGHRVTVHLAPKDLTAAEKGSAHGAAVQGRRDRGAFDGHTDSHPPAHGRKEDSHAAPARSRSPAHHSPGSPHAALVSEESSEKVAVRFAQTQHRVTVHLAPEDFTAETSSTHGSAALEGRKDYHHTAHDRSESPHGATQGHTDFHRQGPAHGHQEAARSRSPAHHRPGHTAPDSFDDKVAVRFAQTQHRVTVHLAPQDFTGAETSSTHGSAGHEAYHHKPAHDHSESPHGATQGHTDAHRHRPADGHKEAGGHTAAARSHSPVHHRPGHPDSSEDSFDDKIALRFAETGHRVTVHLAPKDLIGAEKSSAHGPHGAAHGHTDSHPHKPAHGHTDSHPYKPAHGHTDSQPAHGHPDSHPHNKPAHSHTDSHPHKPAHGHTDSHPHNKPAHSHTDSHAADDKIAVRFAQTAHRVTVHLAPHDMNAATGTSDETSSYHGHHGTHDQSHHRAAQGHTDSQHAAAHDHTNYHHAAAHGHTDTHHAAAQGHTGTHHAAAHGHTDTHHAAHTGTHHAAAQGHTGTHHAAAHGHTDTHHAAAQGAHGHTDTPHAAAHVHNAAAHGHTDSHHGAAHDHTDSHHGAAQAHEDHPHGGAAHAHKDHPHGGAAHAHKDHPHRPAHGHRADDHIAAAHHSPSGESLDDKVAVRFAQTPHRVTVHLAPKDFTAAEGTEVLSSPAAANDSQVHSSGHYPISHPGPTIQSIRATAGYQTAGTRPPGVYGHGPAIYSAPLHGATTETNLHPTDFSGFASDFSAHGTTTEPQPRDWEQPDQAFLLRRSSSLGETYPSASEASGRIQTIRNQNTEGLLDEVSVAVIDVLKNMFVQAGMQNQVNQHPARAAETRDTEHRDAGLHEQSPSRGLDSTTPGRQDHLPRRREQACQGEGVAPSLHSVATTTDQPQRSVGTVTDPDHSISPTYERAHERALQIRPADPARFEYPSRSLPLVRTRPRQQKLAAIAARAVAARRNLQMRPAMRRNRYQDLVSDVDFIVDIEPREEASSSQSAASASASDSDSDDGSSGSISIDLMCTYEFELE